MQPTYLTTEQLAARLGVSVSFLKKARTAGRSDVPPFRKIGPRVVRYRLDDVMAWEAAQEVRTFTH